jgi:hypothetical protein
MIINDAVGLMIINDAVGLTMTDDSKIKLMA